MMSVDGQIKLIDFGLCCDMSQGPRDDTCGSPFWMPPEMIHKKPHDYKVDIWSLAICLLELANGHPPHDHSTIRAMFISATEGHPQPFDNSKKWSEQMKDFFKCCLQIDPNNRGSSEELLRHPWLKKASSQKVMKSVLTDIFIRDTLQSVGFGGI